MKHLIPETPQEYKLLKWKRGMLVSYGAYTKIVYNTRDIIYKHNDDVIHIITHDGFKWASEEYPMELDLVKVETPTREAAKHAQAKVMRKYCDEHPNLTTEEAFFDLPEPSRDIRLKMMRSSAQCFNVSVHVCLNPALQDSLMQELDLLLDASKDAGWLSNVWGWNIGYDVGVSSRTFSGSAKEAIALLNKWAKNCEGKFKKKSRFVVESFV